MPQTIEELTTVELLDIAQGAVFTSFTVQEAFDELRVRIVPTDDPETEWRGGIRPKNPNL